jgi:hypothetical protein
MVTGSETVIQPNPFVAVAVNENRPASVGVNTGAVMLTSLKFLAGSQL